jgi:hypothetical protein
MMGKQDSRVLLTGRIGKTNIEGNSVEVAIRRLLSCQKRFEVE